MALLTISSGNSVSATGLSFAFWKRFARAHDVPVLRVGTRKLLIPAAPLLAAIHRVAEQAQPERELSDDEEKELIRQRLGLKLAADGGRRR